MSRAGVGCATSLEDCLQRLPGRLLRVEAREGAEVVRKSSRRPEIDVGLAQPALRLTPVVAQQNRREGSFAA